jgi:hypothetical protein
MMGKHQVVPFHCENSEDMEKCTHFDNNFENLELASEEIETVQTGYYTSLANSILAVGAKAADYEEKMLE